MAIMYPKPEAVRLAVSGAVFGLLSHWTYFVRGEHHMNAPMLGCLYLGTSLTIFVTELCLPGCTFIEAWQNTSIITGAYALALFASITVYRLLFHRLHSFPGPYSARVSKIWHSWQARYSTNHLLLENLRIQYGTIVRTGPSELTIFSAEANYATDGPGSICSKPDWYDNILPMKSLINIRDKVEHDYRRKVWDQAFSIKALRNYEPRIIKYGEQLDQYLASTSGQSVHSNDWFHFYSFDMMGDLAFGKSFNMLQDERWHHSIAMLREFMSMQGPVSPIPWLVRLAFGLPGLANGWKRWVEFCKQLMIERILTEMPIPDVSSYLINASKENDSLEKDRNFLEGDSMAMILAGSDTTASTLTYIFYHLAKYPDQQQKVREELETIPFVTDFAALQNLPILKSFINETLRLFPPIPTGPPRLSPPEGLTIDGTYIPGDTKIFTPLFSIARLESSFERAHEFMPERWATKSEMIRDQRAWAPFSQGRWGCVGKGLAMKNLTYVTALLVSKYNIDFAPGEDGTRVCKDMKDDFTAVPGKLNLVFTLLKSD